MCDSRVVCWENLDESHSKGLEGWKRWQTVKKKDEKNLRRRLSYLTIAFYQTNTNKPAKQDSKWSNIHSTCSHETQNVFPKGGSQTAFIPTHSSHPNTGFVVCVESNGINPSPCSDINSCDVFLWRVDGEDIALTHAICSMGLRENFLTLPWIKTQEKQISKGFKILL